MESWQGVSEVAVTGLVEQRRETGADPFTRLRLQVLREQCLEEFRLLDLRVRVTNQADEPVPDGAIVYLLPNDHRSLHLIPPEFASLQAGETCRLATCGGEVDAVVLVPPERRRVSLTVLYGPLVKTFEIGLAGQTAPAEGP